MSVAILVVNNLRDIDTDRAAGKRTLAVVLGKRATRVEYELLLVAAFLVPLGLAGAGRSWIVLLPLLSVPLALPLVRSARSFRAPRELNLRASSLDTRSAPSVVPRLGTRVSSDPRLPSER